MVRITKEKISFGLITISHPGDLKMDLKIDDFPALVAIK
jgi:hypothetical protein